MPKDDVLDSALRAIATATKKLAARNDATLADTVRSLEEAARQLESISSQNAGGFDKINSAPSSKNEDARAPTVSFRGAKILIVDDDKDARELLSIVLTESGAVVSEASSVAQALKVIFASPPALVISDIGMPEEDGYELIRRVRASGLSGAQLPAIALTAFGRDIDRKLAHMSGFQTFVTKPVDPWELVRVISGLLA